VSAGFFAAILAALASLIGASPPAPIPTSLPAERPQLQADLALAERIIDDPASSAVALAGAGQLQQLATWALAGRPPAAARAALAGISKPAARAMHANLEAAAALGRLVAPRRALPRWRIAAPPPAGALLGDFKAAQARFGVPWEYLAAIEFVETRFGRVQGLSVAGAEGPMQFVPATWARYGRGNVHDAREAVFGAARYLVANGASRDMPAALHHYNPSSDYVHAVTDYAERMHEDPRAYYGYYWWQVIYARRGGAVILPVGYPAARPLPVTPP
jgi:membrane-bound lytic murein transglycosylase B